MQARLAAVCMYALGRLMTAPLVWMMAAPSIWLIGLVLAVDGVSSDRFRARIEGAGDGGLCAMQPPHELVFKLMSALSLSAWFETAHSAR
jgi:hypothetical protein